MSDAPASPPDAEPTSLTTWQRVRERKVVQWTLAYIALAYGLLQGIELVGHAFEWPFSITRIATVVLALGIPVAALLAWYHGDRGQQRVSGAELAILTVLFLIGGTVLWIMARGKQEHPQAPATQPAATATQTSPGSRVAATAPRASVAVVPFANLTGEPAKEYFSDGMAEELINALAGVPGLKVPARTSSFAYKGRNMDVRQIARDLEVATVLEGSVRSAGERVRVTAQLVDGNTGYHMWSQSYDRKFADLFKLQEELATAIVQALRVHMHAELPSTVTPAAPTQDLGAYDLYLQARAVMARGEADSMVVARELLEKATARDPQFAGAYAVIGLTHIVSFNSGNSADPSELVMAERAAQGALSLDPNVVVARAVLARVNSFRRNWVAALKDYQAALALNDQEPGLHNSYSGFLMDVGHTREALREAHAAQRIAPAYAPYALAVAVAYSILGMHPEAMDYSQRSLNLGMSPGIPVFSIMRARAALDDGRTQEAATQAVQALTPSLRDSGGADAVRLVFAALADSSKKGAAIQALRELRSSAPEMQSSGTMLLLSISWFASLGALDSAYEVADQRIAGLARSGTTGAAWGPIWVPEMLPFRQDPRFQAFTERLRLMEYWKQYGPPDNCELRDGKLICN